MPVVTVCFLSSRVISKVTWRPGGSFWMTPVTASIPACPPAIVVPFTALITSPACSLPAAGLPSVTEATTTSLPVGLMSRAARAAVTAESCESVISWVFSASLCCCVCPGG